MGQSLCRVVLNATAAASVEVQLQDPLPYLFDKQLAGNSGDQVTLQAPLGPIVRFSDPQGVLLQPRLDPTGQLLGVLGTNAGHHMVIAYVQAGRAAGGAVLEHMFLFKIFVNDTQAAAEQAWRTPAAADPAAQWVLVDTLPRLFNANISDIYYPGQGGYLSPRPPTCSARIGNDGYSAWTFPYGQGDVPPHPDFSLTPPLVHAGVLTTPQQGARFAAAFDGPRNVAFTSLWDYFPTSITVPAPPALRSALGSNSSVVAWALVAGSTNPMQTRLANARLLFQYANGTAEALDLVPPLNYWTLSEDGGVDYNFARDAYALPASPPPQVQLGRNLRAMVYAWRLLPGAVLSNVTLETLSSDVVVGLLGLSFAVSP